jgi:hypothetical protein
MKMVRRFWGNESGMFSLNPGTKGLLICMLIVAGLFSVSGFLRDILGNMHI